MSTPLKILFLVTMSFALGFGYMHHIMPEYHFERLHIFLFNLCSGGTIILYFTMDEGRMTKRLYAFYILSFAYAFFAFFECYPPAIGISLVLFLIVESVRNRKFGFFPFDFFTLKVPSAQKFHHASLLCLSIGLLISVFAIINSEYGHWLNFEKLSLNTFFLGFSFPVSLISLSVMFSTMHKARQPFFRYLKVVSFWVITLGVVVFFGFILFEAVFMELTISLILFAAVSAVLYMYIKLGIKEQQKAFLTSGIVFLLITSISGVLYILIYAVSYKDPFYTQMVILYHRFLALYGWNISGLAVICRFKDFPIMMHSGIIITLHWIIVAILAPIGYFKPEIAVVAVVTYIVFLIAMFFSRGSLQKRAF